MSCRAFLPHGGGVLCFHVDMSFILTGSLSHVAWAVVRVRIPQRCAEGAVADSH